MSIETGSHWYSRSGEPHHFVDRAKGDGQRPATLADARKQGWVPSPTSILKVLFKKALVDWMIDQAVNAVLTAPRREGETVDQFKERVLVTERDAEREAEKARDLGTEIHEALDLAIRGEGFVPDLTKYIEPALTMLLKIGRPTKTEFVVVGNGYAGRVDCVLDDRIVVDFKTAKKLPDPDKGGAWWEHKLQLAAYAKAGGYAETGILYISTTEPGKNVWCPHKDWTSSWLAFHALLQYWQIANNYHTEI